jgi:hypothetical protein
MVDVVVDNTTTETVSENKFHNGKIYKIVSGNSDLFYIGSTCSSLKRRFGVHLKAFQTKKCYVSSYEVIKNGEPKIELIESIKCETAEELRRREGELIKMNKDRLVNIRIAGRTRSEHYNDNRERIIQKMREFRAKNLEEIRKKDRERKRAMRAELKRLSEIKNNGE